MPAGRDVRAPLALALLAVAFHFFPIAPEMLDLSRTAIQHGELWRILTGHFTHFTNAHLMWDVAAFAILSIMVAGRSMARWIACMIGAAITISLAVLLLQPEVTVYRGLSGLDSALFVTAAVMLLQEGWQQKRHFLTGFSLLALAAFSAKTLFELTTGNVLFVQDLGEGVSPLPLAHIIGAGWGLTAALCPLSFPGAHSHTPRLQQNHLRQSTPSVGHGRSLRNQEPEGRCAHDRQHSAGGTRGAHSR
jgi:rhomboid family GlyGly-CTERM serine protease